MTTLSEIVEDSWRVAEEAGWHAKISTGIEGTCTRLMLIVSEVAEAMEEARTKGTILHYYSNHGEHNKPEGFGAELADVIIRVCDLAAIEGIDLETCVVEKAAFNAVRADVPSRFTGDNAKQF